MQKLLRIKQWVACVLCVAMLTLGFAPKALARETDFFASLDDVAGNYTMAGFGEIPADSSSFATYRERLLLMNDIKNRDELIKALLNFNNEYLRLQAAESLVMYQYYCDPEKYGENYRAWEDMIAEVERDYQATWQEMAASDNRPMLEDLVAPQLLARFDDMGEVSDSTLAKKQRIQAMTADYWQKIDKNYTVTYKGHKYSMAELDKIKDADTYTEVYKLLAKARNKELAGLLADIIPVANSYAKEIGYSGYADYAYAEIYGRDFAPSEVAKLHSLVKQYIVPFYNELLVAQDDARFDWQRLSEVGDMSGDELLALLQQYLPEISDEYAAAFDYMQDHALANVDESEAKLGVSFTSYISYYHIALLFMGSHSGTAHDLTTLVHEFGHFAYYMYEQRDCGYDVGEFHSQGLQMLFLQFADEIFGDAAATHRLNELILQLKAVIDGCLFDEFQQQAYAMQKPTVSELNRLFHRLAEEYGYVYLHDDDEAYDWVTTAHTFIQPFYYISYAVSGLTALELLGQTDDDFAAACDKYLAMATIHENGYQAFAKKTGMADIFSDGGMQKIAQGLREYFDGVICGGKPIEAPEVSQGEAAEEKSFLAAAAGLLDNAGAKAGAYGLLWRLIWR